MLSKLDIRQTDPGSPEEFYIINENLDEYVKNILEKLNIQALSVTRLGGAACVNLKIETKDGNYVLKISPYDGILQVSEYFYRRIRELNLSTPQVINLDRDKKTIPFEFMLMDFIDGLDVTKLPTEKHFEAGILVGNALRKIHSIVVKDFDSYIASYRIWDNDKWLTSLSFYIQSVPESIKIRLFSTDEIKLIESLIESPDLVIDVPYLLHGDIHKENCLFIIQSDNLELKALIDPNTLFGDSMFDLATAEVLNIDVPDFYKGIREGYGNITKQEQKRVNILRVIFIYWLITWRVSEGKDVTLYRNKLNEYLVALT